MRTWSEIVSVISFIRYKFIQNVTAAATWKLGPLFRCCSQHIHVSAFRRAETVTARQTRLRQSPSHAHRVTSSVTSSHARPAHSRPSPSLSVIGVSLAMSWCLCCPYVVRRLRHVSSTAETHLYGLRRPDLQYRTELLHRSQAHWVYMLHNKQHRFCPVDFPSSLNGHAAGTLATAVVQVMQSLCSVCVCLQRLCACMFGQQLSNKMISDVDILAYGSSWH